MPAVNPNELYKYRLKELWALCFGSTGEQMKKQFLQENPPLHMHTLYHDFNIKRGDAAIIPAERLKKYAIFLNFETDALRNYQNPLAA